MIDFILSDHNNREMGIEMEYGSVRRRAREIQLAAGVCRFTGTLAQYEK